MFFGENKRRNSIKTDKEQKTEKKKMDRGGDGKITRHENHLYFYGMVTQETMAELLKEIREADVENAKKCMEFDLEVFHPIHLHLHSYGGYLDAGMAAAENLKRTKCPLHTHIEGCAMSAATLISAVGAHRTIGENSHVRIHQLRDMLWGTFTDIEEEFENTKKAMERLKDFYLRTTKIPKKRLSEFFTKEIDISPQECLDLGFVDEILGF